MRLRRRSPKPQQETIVTLIDIVFFLLVFFMLVGRMDATSPFEIKPPISDRGDALPAGGETITLALDGRLALNGVEASRGEIVTLLENRRDGRGEALFVRVNADAKAPLRFLLPLVSVLEALAEGDVVLVVTPEKL